jgi:hypothetical protein
MRDVSEDTTEFNEDCPGFRWPLENANVCCSESNRFAAAELGFAGEGLMDAKSNGNHGVTASTWFWPVVVGAVICCLAGLVVVGLLSFRILGSRGHADEATHPLLNWGFSWPCG